MKRKIKVFISYAHRNRDSARKFFTDFEEYCKCSKNFHYDFWRDSHLRVGEKWDEEIRKNLEESHCGLLLVSPSFLNSSYIREKELSYLMKTEKVLIPVGFSKINFEKHDLLGLEEYQIFRYYDEGFKEPRCYMELKGKRRIDFIDELFSQLEDRLMKIK